MITISAVILARNEEYNIRYCLETLQWCDEIVVVDMDSTDKTAAIAREFTDKVFFHEKILAFDIAKKFGVDKATSDWILLIDADEMVQRSLANRLRSIAEDKSADIVEIPFKHYILGDWVRYTGWGYSHLPRFFLKGKINFTETIHGYMHKVQDTKVLRLESNDENCIYHFNYTNSAHFVEKLNRYTSIEAHRLYEDKIPFSYGQLIFAALKEFFGRYFAGKGYKEGTRGFSLSVMMAFYRALTYIKLWEMYQFEDDPILARYEKIRNTLLKAWRVTKS
jgi:glycosyltransferase involved in cell wall biosynthesis